MSSLSRIFTTMATALFVAGAAAGPASAAIPAMAFSIRPDPNGSLSAGQDYFVLRAEPDDVVGDALEVSNRTSRPVDVMLAAVDATTAQLGGVDYTPSESRPRAAGAWIELEETALTLTPGEVRTVPFSITVPPDPPSGVNLGGIAAWTPPPGDDSADEGLTAAAEVQTRRVVAVQVELPGPAEPVLEIRGVTAVARPDGTYLQVDIHNVGHGFAEGEGTLELPGESFSSVLPLDKVVPGTGVGYPVRWQGRAPAEGTYPVIVELDYGAGVAEYRGDVVVGGALRTELADRGIGNEPPAFPVLPVAAGASLCAAGAGAILLRRRRKRGPAAPARAVGSPAPPGPPPPPSPPTRRPPPPPPAGTTARR